MSVNFECVIYTLSDPRTGAIRYVGQSTRMKNRYAVHVSPFTKGDKSRRRAWIEELLGVGLKPILCVVEKCSLGDLDARERFWIAKLSDCDLVNVTAGGSGIVAEGVRRRLSAATAERNRQRAGTPMSLEVRAHLSRIHKERLAGLTPDERKARTEAALAKRRPGYNAGWKHTEQSKAAIGAKNAVALKGRHISAEHVAALRAGHRRYWGFQ